ALVSVVLASALVRAFSGKGLVPDAALTPEFLVAAGLGAAATVGLATLRHLPISTTHALVGSLTGAGLAAVGGDVALSALGKSFVLPLLVGPLLAFFGARLLARGGGAAATRMGIRPETCVCIDGEWLAVTSDGQMAYSPTPTPQLLMADLETCRERYPGRVAGIAVNDVVSGSHLVSASLVGFARGLNDTPKILGLMAGAGITSLSLGAGAIAGVMAAGGWWASRGVAETLAHGITDMTPAEGLAGNLTTSLLVIGASRLGLPVSTTHVSAGGIFGLGASNGAMRRRMVRDIVGAWLLTLPVAALLAAATKFALDALA
ncbi:MAG: inorganic phosphate transporter, partial [Deltaproteobacteria bacterium]|nr:inorganic phosphate transporter [Deltaproteobacteria bacterium]